MGILLAPWEVGLYVSGHHLQPYWAVQLREMLTTADLNEDGVISHEEFVGASETISWVRAQVNTSAACKTCQFSVGVGVQGVCSLMTQIVRTWNVLDSNGDGVCQQPTRLQ